MNRSYPGSKTAAGNWQHIISQVPPCDRFIDAMAGSGIISNKLAPHLPQIIANDINAAVIAAMPAVPGIVKTCMDYRLLMQFLTPKSVIYFDPPYLLSTRSTGRKYYQYEWTDADHSTFLHWAGQLDCRAMISHYPCELYDDLLPAWRKITYNTMTRAGVREESLYLNYDQPELLAVKNHAGSDFTDRQRIKRKVARLISRLQNEPAADRAAILTAVTEHFKRIFDRTDPA